MERAVYRAHWGQQDPKQPIPRAKARATSSAALEHGNLMAYGDRFQQQRRAGSRFARSAFYEHPDFALFFRAATDYGLLLPNFSGIWLPRPEPKWITRRHQYDLARSYLMQRGRFLLLVGYSFGRQPSGGIDDRESFEFFREILKRFPRRIVVVDPFPDHVAGLFEDALHQRIYACSLYWDCLAKAACLATEGTPDAPNLLAIQSRITRLYDERTR